MDSGTRLRAVDDGGRKTETETSETIRGHDMFVGRSSWCLFLLWVPEALQCAISRTLSLGRLVLCHPLVANRGISYMVRLGQGQKSAKPLTQNGLLHFGFSIPVDARWL